MDKFGEMQAAGFSMSMVGGLPVLSDCCGWMEVAMLQDTPVISCGDHDVTMWEVVAHSGPSLSGEVLTTGDLRSRGLM